MGVILIAGLPRQLAEAVAAELDGHAVDVVDDGAGAAAAMASRPDVFLVDGTLTEPGPAAVVHRLRVDLGLGDAGVVLRTNDPDGPLASRLTENGVIDRAVGRDAGSAEVAEVVRGLLPAPQPTGEQRELSDAVSAIWERVRGPMLERVETLEAAAATLLTGELAEDEARDAERAAHKVAGSAGTFCFAEASRLARQLEQLLASDERAERAHEAASLVVTLRDSLTDGPAAKSSGDPVATGGVILVRSVDPVTRRALVDALTARDGRPLRWDGGTMEEEVCGAVIEVSDPADTELIARLSEEGHGPILAIVDPDRFTDRVEASRAGANLVLPTSATPERIADAIVRRVAGSDTVARQATVLLVDDDPVIHEWFREVARGGGWRTEHCEDPMSFWERYEETAPDLIVLDLDMPSIDGVDLCRSLRSDPQGVGIPVIFLTARTDSATVNRMFEAGGDDCIAKPFDAAELLARLSARLRRGHAGWGEDGHFATLAGLADWSATATALDRLLGEASRHGAPIAVVSVHVEGLRDLNARRGIAVGDDVIGTVSHAVRAEVSGDDLAGRATGAEFVLAFPGLDALDGAHRVRDLVATVRAELDDVAPVRVIAGVSESPRDGADAQQLHAAARAARMEAAEGTRGDRVRAVGEDRGTVSCDVVIVDDDETLTPLLAHALGGRGLRTQTIHDGIEAIERLGGDTPSLRGSVVLLDVDLAGRSGLDVLRRLQEDGVLETTRVIMLTARSTEVEVLDALEHGAFDHIGKPFSLPVLLQRVRRALGD